MNKGWLIGGPLIAGVLAGWQYISSFLARIRSLFIVKVSLDGHLTDIISFYCWHNLARTKMGDYRYTAWREFLRPRNRYQMISFEVVGQSGAIFWNGWTPMFVHAVNRKDNETTDGNMSMIYIRGTLDLDIFITKATETYNEFVVKGLRSKRFYVGQSMGTLGEMQLNKDPEDKALSDPDTSSHYNHLLDKRMLKWKFDDIGQKMHVSGDAFEFLELPKNIWTAVEEIKRWSQSEDWYRHKGIPWKRGWLLYGLPGTGKTSLVRAIAEHIDLPVIRFLLSTFTDRDFQRAWGNLQERVPCIALIEDIDTVFHGRKNLCNTAMLSGKPLSFDVLLNMIDGIQSSDGVFTVVTSNATNHIDPALGNPTDGKTVAPRPGRIDRIIELGRMVHPQRKALAERILSEIPDVIERIVVEGDEDSPAQFLDRCAKIALEDFWESSE